MEWKSFSVRDCIQVYNASGSIVGQNASQGENRLQSTLSIFKTLQFVTTKILTISKCDARKNIWCYEAQLLTNRKLNSNKKTEKSW